MRELRLHSDGLRLEEADRPVPGEGEVLVRVHAAAITREELEWPTDRLPAVPSHELSGVVAETGEELFALTPFERDGVAADYALVPAVVLAAKPARLTHVEAAALPMGGLSAWQGLFVHGRLQAGERVLITGASGGVGHLAVELARHAGAEVVEEGAADLVFDTVGGELPGLSGSSRSRRRRRARPISSSSRTASSCSSWRAWRKPGSSRRRSTRPTRSSARGRRSSGWRSGASAARLSSMSPAPSSDRDAANTGDVRRGPSRVTARRLGR